jgi:N-acetylmuramoyl-L-alanine amidase
MGTGLRIFSALLPVSGSNLGPFVDWQTAQSSSLGRSRYLQQQLFANIQKMGFPARSLTAPLRPLNNIRAPALAIEVAPTTSNTAQLATTNYQEMVSAALASALSSLLSSLRPATGIAP